MASVLQVERLSKSFGADVLFSDITFGVDEGEKIGLIAKNGTGKSTLLNILAGVDTPDSGTVTLRNGFRVGYLPQSPTFPGDLTVMDACLLGDDRRSQAVRRYERVLMGNADDNEMAEAVHEMDAADAWGYEDRFKQVLTMLKMDNFAQPVSQLSGGQVKRIALARILIGEPQLLILDEPTNHLDIDMIEWLEGYLKRASATLLMVTHDRYFLDNICGRILEMDDKCVFSYSGNYNYYLEKRAERVHAQTVAVERAKNLLRTELDWMRRQPQARAHKAKYRIDAFYDLREQAARRVTDGDVRMNVGAAYIGNKIFIAHDVSKRWGDKVMLDKLNYTFSRYEKLGIVGDNGVGKSTFVKLLLGQIQPDSGHFEIGETVRWGYYSQEGIAFDETQRVIDAARDIAEYVAFDERTSYTASQFLNLFLFSARDQQKLIAKLSGGERRRLYLATVLMKKPNFLILDEPTNDLDITTLAVLEDYLTKFKGCVIIVTHDRFFMDRTVDHTWVFQGHGVIKDFPGNYSEYRAWKEFHERAEERPSSPPASRPHTHAAARDNSHKLTYKEKKEMEEIDGQMQRLEAEKRELDLLFSGGTAIPDAADKSVRYRQVSEDLDRLEMRWLELSEKQP